MAKVQDNQGNWGEWKTIKGRKVFIRDGEDLATAMQRSGKFKTKFSSEEVSNLKQQGRKGMAQAIDKINQEPISENFEVYEDDNGYRGKGKELLKFIEAEEEDSGISISDKIKNELKLNAEKEYVFDNNNEKIIPTKTEQNLKETFISDVSKDLGIEPGSDEEWQLNELYETSEENPLEDMANDRIKEKENTLINDKAILDQMKKKGINEIQGWTQEDFENRIAKNEEYLSIAKSQEELKNDYYSGKDNYDFNIENKLQAMQDKMDRLETGRVYANDLQIGQPYKVDYGNGIEKTATYVGKNENGNNVFYDGEGVSGNFEFSDKFIEQGSARIYEDKYNDDTMHLHNEIIGNIDNMSNNEVYEEAWKLRDETSDYSLREKIDRKLNSIDRLNKRGEGFADKPTNELRDILKEEATRDKGSIEIKDNNGELTGYTEGERVEYHHSGSTGLMANVYSTDNGSLSGQYFEVPKEYQGDKLKEYSLREIERLKSDKKAYNIRQEEGMDKFIQQVDMYGGTREYSSEDLKRMEEAGVRPMANSYTGGGWEGINSRKNLSTKEQAKAITDAMKKKYSDVKISRKSDVYSGGSSIDFNIMSSDKDLYISDKEIDSLASDTASGQKLRDDITRGYGFDRWAKENVPTWTERSREYTTDDIKRYAKEQVANMRKRDNQNVRGNEWYLSDYGKKVVSDLNKEADSYTYSDNDGMVDYFNHGTYMHVSIGKWDKPYEVKPKVAKTKVDNIEAKTDRVKLSYQKNFAKDGSVITQTATISEKQKDSINKAIENEIKNGYPNHKKYASDINNAKWYLEKLNDDYTDTTNTTNKFIKYHLGNDKIKTDRNTRYKVDNTDATIERYKKRKGKN